ncbi:MAG: DUF4347 domain-containing protein, partial [Alphaproteobacteria bacterium]|nr:DUF4347 domain-containing protein [Alphaproteobacteria bacterium]
MALTVPSSREIAFVDPSVDDLDTLLAGLRPEVSAVVLDRAVPVAAQIARALAHARGLDAVHVIAHGAPGRIEFAAGAWSAASLATDAADLAAIGRALGDDGELRLWSCAAGAGPEGTRFVTALAEAAGAPVAAADGLVGAAAPGGTWQLAYRMVSAAAARAPLTDAGAAAYRGVLAVATWKGATGSISTPGDGDWSFAAAWADDTVPGASDDVVLSGGADDNYTVSLDQGDGATIGSLALSSDGGAAPTLYVAAGKTLHITNSISGTGTIKLGDGATLKVDGSVGHGVKVSFSGATGKLDVAGAFDGTLAGMIV